VQGESEVLFLWQKEGRFVEKEKAKRGSHIFYHKVSFMYLTNFLTF